MDQPRPGYSRMKSPIIDRPDLLTVRHRTIAGVVTLVIWVAWSYLWLPLLALVAWALGLQQAYKYMIVLGGYQEVLRVMGLYALVLLLLCGGLYAWATYSILRFRGIERRTGERTPTADQVALHFEQAPVAVESWRRAQRLYVTHDKNGDIDRVEILETGAPCPEVLTEALPR